MPCIGNATLNVTAQVASILAQNKARRAQNRSVYGYT